MDREWFLSWALSWLRGNGPPSPAVGVPLWGRGRIGMPITKKWIRGSGVGFRCFCLGQGVRSGSSSLSGGGEMNRTAEGAFSSWKGGIRQGFGARDARLFRKSECRIISPAWASLCATRFVLSSVAIRVVGGSHFNPVHPGVGGPPGRDLPRIGVILAAFQHRIESVQDLPVCFPAAPHRQRRSDSRWMEVVSKIRLIRARTS